MKTNHRSECSVSYVVRQLLLAEIILSCCKGKSYASVDIVREANQQIKVSYNLQYSSHLLKNTCHVTPPSPPPPPPPPPMLIHVSPICNRPFPSSTGPRYQNEVKCSAFDMEMILYSHANKTRFHENGCALGLILKVRVFGFWNSEVAC